MDQIAPHALKDEVKDATSFDDIQWERFLVELGLTYSNNSH